VPQLVTRTGFVRHRWRTMCSAALERPLEVYGNGAGWKCLSRLCELVVRRKRIVSERCRPCRSRVLQLITAGMGEWSWGGPRMAASRISWTRVSAQTIFSIFLGDMRAIRKLTYSLDRTLYSCLSPSLVILGSLRDVNGVGVTQNMTITYHASVLPVSWPWLIFLCQSVGRLAAGTIKRMDRPP
jgi:hypothetical protein